MEISVETLAQLIQDRKLTARLIDVRRPEEFTGELGHIEGAQLMTLGPDLEAGLEKMNPSAEIIFICRSGKRSGDATELAHQMGFKKSLNMIGGMLRWNELQLPITR